MIITFKRTERRENVPKTSAKIGISPIWVEMETAKGKARNFGILIFVNNFLIDGARIAMEITQAKLIWKPTSKTDNGLNSKIKIPARPIALRLSYFFPTIDINRSTIAIIDALTTDVEKLQT